MVERARTKSTHGAEFLKRIAKKSISRFVSPEESAVGSQKFKPVASCFRNQRRDLRYSMAAGYLPLSPVYASPCNTTSYNTGNGGGGNCSRSHSGANTDSQCRYGTYSLGWPEMGREGETLCELVANWRRLTPYFRDQILELVRSCRA